MRLSPIALLVPVLVCGCTDHSKKMKDKMAEREQAKKDLDKVAEAKRKAAIPVIEAAKLDPPWDDPKYQRVAAGKPCPEGMWALFTAVLGEGEEQKKNATKKDELGKTVRKGRLRLMSAPRLARLTASGRLDLRCSLVFSPRPTSGAALAPPPKDTE